MGRGIESRSFRLLSAVSYTSLNWPFRSTKLLVTATIASQFIDWFGNCSSMSSCDNRSSMAREAHHHCLLDVDLEDVEVTENTELLVKSGH